jgi:hypothetical protein
MSNVVAEVFAERLQDGVGRHRSSVCINSPHLLDIVGD